MAEHPFLLHNGWYRPGQLLFEQEVSVAGESQITQSFFGLMSFSLSCSLSVTLSPWAEGPLTISDVLQDS